MCEICGKCKWHWCDDKSEWYCNNRNSELFEEFTEYNDACDAFEEK